MKIFLVGGPFDQAIKEVSEDLTFLRIPMYELPLFEYIPTSTLQTADYTRLILDIDKIKLPVFIYMPLYSEIKNNNRSVELFRDDQRKHALRQEAIKFKDMEETLAGYLEQVDSLRSRNVILSTQRLWFSIIAFCLGALIAFVIILS